MIAGRKVLSLRFEAKGNPVGYLMVETDDEDLAVKIARLWAKTNLHAGFDSIERHQGVIDPPGDEMAEWVDGLRVWELPF